MLKNINQILEDLEQYLSDNYIEEEPDSIQEYEEREQDQDHSDTTKAADIDSDASEALSLEDMLESIGESFQEMLFRKIEERGMTYVEVYKRAGIDRRLSSKIRSNPAYHPSKVVVLQLAISLRLCMKETEDLLSTAEYAFSANNKRDIIVQFFIEKGIYDFDTINYCLYEYNQPLLADPKTRGV